MNLPPNIAHRLEQTLAQWQHWHGPGSPPGAPHIERQLSGGQSNYTILVAAADQRYVVRLDRANPAANGLNRQAEWRVLHAAHAAGIAPRPCYFNPELGALVCDYLAPDTTQHWTATELAGLLQCIHGLPQLRFRMDPAERMRRYERQLPPDRQGLISLGNTIRTRVRPEQDQLRLCHHDLNPSNLILSGGALYALDWEYCAMGNTWFDLAVVIQECELDEAGREELLSSYLGRAAELADRQALQNQTLIARYLALLWFATGQGDTLDTQDLRRRESALHALLELSP